VNERHEERDEAIGALAMLTMHEPDPARAARVLARGRARLVARANRRPLAASRAPRGGWGRTLEPLLVAGASAVFLFEVLVRATELYRF
jgi:hypothetical protein